LLKPEIPESIKYPFCPLCFGIRDKINNLLEVGSTIKSIKVEGESNSEFITNSKDIPTSV
jgi:hypothetical protein